MSLNGCHNREPLRTHAIVQEGWSAGWISQSSEVTRKPVMIEIADPMTKTCQYQRLKKDDPKCLGCRELET